MEISLLLKGMAMGFAEAIPGVSGGTIAFITGIYERLLNAVDGVLSAKGIQAYRSGGIAAAWKAIDGPFILQLGIGTFIGLGVAIFTITELIDRYPPVVWAFFFGLIISSSIYVARQVDRWTFGTVALLVLGAVVAFGLTSVNPLTGSSNLLLVFLAGSVAISALILPGISGSFILLILGMYTIVLGAVRNLAGGDLASGAIVAVFALGCVAGLAVFSRALKYTFGTYPNQTLAVLTGFMIGSLNKLWPWRNVVTTRRNSAGEEVPLLEANVLPANYVEGETYTLYALLFLLLGLVIVFVLDYFGRGETEAEVIEEQLP